MKADTCADLPVFRRQPTVKSAIGADNKWAPALARARAPTPRDPKPVTHAGSGPGCGYDHGMAEPTRGRRLKPRAHIIRTFGDELISSETGAVIELVKNSYDVDATSVLVRFTAPFEAGLQGAVRRAGISCIS
jgi:hypothetical protein